MADDIDLWQDFFRRYYWDEILELANAYPEKRSLLVKHEDVFRYDLEVSESLLEKPDEVLRNATKALRDITILDVSLDEAHVRVISLLRKINIRALRKEHLGKFIALDGLVRKATEVRPKVVKAAFECVRCGHLNEIEQGRTFKEPYACEGCGKRGPFIFNKDKSKFTNSQKLMLQEAPEDLEGGEQPQTINVELEDDLTGITSPGDRVIVSGILRSYQRTSPLGSKSPSFEIYVEGNSIELEEKVFESLEITSEDEARIKELGRDPEIYDKIVSSIAPSIYGYREIKEAIALQIFSGLPKHLPDGTRIRGDVHILTVGDPGVGKSQLLRYVSNLSPRGIYSTGKGTTAAGLTATAVRDEFGEGRWSLEAGALVLADHGIAAIDEIDKMSDVDQAAMHEALEQQSISVAKAGIMAVFKSRCALLAAANPRDGRFDVYEPIANQIEIPPVLLSRFDLIFPITDEPDEKNDTRVAEHILRSHYAGEVEVSGNGGEIIESTLKKARESIQSVIPPDLLRKYIAYSRRNVFPILSEEAFSRFKDFYVSLRSVGEKENAPVPITARELEALVRLGEACARLRLSNSVTLDDAERVIGIVESCLKQVGIDMETGDLDIDVIKSGFSKTQRNKYSIIRKLIRKLTDEEGVVMVDTLLEQAEEFMGRDECEKIISEFVNRGEIFRSKGRIKRA